MIVEYDKTDLEFIENGLSDFQQNISVENIFSNPFTKVYIYKESKNIGFIICSKYYERMELDYIYVENSFRKKGIASKLINYIIDKNADIKNITLEVSVQNIPAIKLYQKFNFKIVATREKYYNGIDAYLMERK